MSRNRKKKKDRKQLTDQQPKTIYEYNNWRQRDVDPELLKVIEGLDWSPSRCYIGCDWESQRVCVILPDPLDNSIYRYLELNLINSQGCHLLWGSEIEKILKKAKKAGRKRRRL